MVSNILNYIFLNWISYIFQSVLWTVKPYQNPGRGWKNSFYIGPNGVQLLTNRSILRNTWMIYKCPAWFSLPARNNILIFWKLHQDLAPAALRICSYESQNVRDQGAILSQQGRNPLYRAGQDEVRKSFLRFLFLTKKSFSFDSGYETVQRVLVDETPSLLICRLVHNPRLHHICRSPHDGSNQAEG